MTGKRIARIWASRSTSMFLCRSQRAEVQDDLALAGLVESILLVAQLARLPGLESEPAGHAGAPASSGPRGSGCARDLQLDALADRHQARQRRGHRGLGSGLDTGSLLRYATAML
jgi:hypothetical protein